MMTFFVIQPSPNANHAIRANRRNNFLLVRPFLGKIRKRLPENIGEERWADTDQGGAAANSMSRNAIL